MTRLSKTALANFAAAGWQMPEGRAPLRRAKSAGTKKRKHPEYDLHVKVVTALKKRLPADACVLHIPNARQGNDQRAQTDRMHRDRMGVMQGAPDLLVIRHGRVLGIELKASAGQLSPMQQWAHSVLLGCGVAVAVCRTLEEVESFLALNGAPLREQHRSKAAGEPTC